jgi:hypothetical protein
MRHPAEYFIKYLIVRHPDWNQAAIEKHLSDWGFLLPPDYEKNYFTFLKGDLPPIPENFDPLDFTHRPSLRYLRDLGIYEIFRNTPEMQEAWNILASPDQRLIVEQILLSRINLKTTCKSINEKYNWFLSEGGVSTYRHYFWNPKLLTFDEWGRFLYGRAALYDRYMALLQGDAHLALYHLRLAQAVESKEMIQRAQEIAHYTLEEVNLQPGTNPNKVKAIAVLSKAIVECHEALSTSDMALKDVLKNFERFRMEHPQKPPPDINALAPLGNFSGGAQDEKEKGELKN